jgi:hypothetical protein
VLRGSLVRVFALLPVVAAAASKDVPAGFRGVWAPNLAECRDIDGVNHLTIKRRSFNFYEGRSDPDDFQIEIVSPRRVNIRTVIEYGEAEVAFMRFELSPDRQALFWSGYGRDPQPKDPYVRCPS